MKRLVYSPRVNVFVKRDDGKVIDLSECVTDVTVTRRVNAVSKATVTFRNPKMRFTNHKWKDGIGPMFHPMDPIIISMTRIKNRPIQVFAGFCDKTPYLQLFPGTCVIEASCTLKRLQYTYWDPGLPFVWNFLEQNGWQIDRARGGIANADQESRDLGKQRQLTDGSIGGLLFNVLTEVGGWDARTVFIENMPKKIVPVVENLFKDIKTGSAEAQGNFEYVLRQMIGETTLGLGMGEGGGGEGVTGSGDLSDAPEELQNFPRKRYYSKSEIRALCEAARFPDPGYAAGVCWEESSGDSWNDSWLATTTGRIINKTSYDPANPCCHGLWQLFLSNSPVDNNVFSNTEKGWQNARDPLLSTWHVANHIRGGGSWSPWQATHDGITRIGS